MALQEGLCAWVADATWNTRPDHDSRITNIHSLASTPAITAWNSTKSTSASAPGACACGTMPGTVSRSSSARRRHIPGHRHLGHARAGLGDQPLPDPPGRVPLLARHVPVRQQPPVADPAYGPIAGRGRGRYAFRGGGTALASACRT